MRPIRKFILLALILGFAALWAESQTPGLKPVPPNIKLVEQSDSPVRLTLAGVRTVDGQVRMIALRAENLSSKGLAAIATGGMSEGEVNGQMTFASPLRFGRSVLLSSMSTKHIDGEREIWIDAVIFDDGSVWGPDRNGSVQVFRGMKSGRLRLIEDVSDVLAANDEVALKEFLYREPYLPEYAKIEKKSKFEEGFVRGYGSELFGLRQTFADGVAAVAARVKALKEESSGAKDTEQKRISKLLSVNDVLKIERIEVGGREVFFDDPFLGGRNWLQNMKVTVKNISGKPIVSFALNIDLPETTATGNIVNTSVLYGRRPGLPIHIKVEERPILMPYSSVELQISSDELLGLTRTLTTRQPPEQLSKAELGFRMVYFEDGTLWSAGSMLRKDPGNPNRWIPIEVDK